MIDQPSSFICPSCRRTFDADSRCPAHPKVEPRRDRTGETLHGFTVRSLVHVEKHSAIWRAETADGLVAALKCIEPSDPVRARRLLMAARETPLLHGADISELITSGTRADGVVYRLSAWSNGKPVGGPLPIKTACHLAILVAQALASAHSRGVVHQNLKPSNILIYNGNSVMITDFGTYQPQVGPLGNVVYDSTWFAAPELLDDQSPDPQMDIYALGGLIYWMIRGRPPLEEPTRAKLIAAHHTRSPNVGETFFGILKPIVERALAKRPQDRFADLSEMIEALTGRDVPVAPPQVIAVREGLTAQSLPDDLPTPPPALSMLEDLGDMVSALAGQDSAPGLIRRSVAPAQLLQFDTIPPEVSVESPTASSPSEVVPPDEKRRKPIWIWAIPVVLLIGGGVALALGPHDSPPTPDSVPIAAYTAQGVAHSPDITVPVPDAAVPDAAVPVDIAVPVDSTVVAKTALIRLNSVPTGARVFRDGVHVGHTPYAANAKLGTVYFTVRMRGYRPQNVQFDVAADETNERTLRLRQGRKRAKPVLVTAVADSKTQVAVKVTPAKPKQKRPPGVQLIGAPPESVLSADKRVQILGE